MRRTFPFFFLVLALLILPGRALAALSLCNRTSYVLYAATAAIAGSGSQVKGWTRIMPGDCQDPIKDPLGHARYLVYARSSLAHSGPQHEWGGAFPACVKEGNFVIRQKMTQPYCTADDTFPVPFGALDTHGLPDTRMNFDEKPALGSLIAAQLAGVKRLLRDNGYATGAIGGKPDAATAKSLTTFRARMHFAPTAGNTELFAALEAGALRANAPAGYTVCNDTHGALLLAMTERGGGKALSRGWWKVAGGACARLITMPLNTDSIWLLAQRPGGGVVVGGPERFCVTQVTFQIQAGGSCPGSLAGFVRTRTAGLAGYVAHIGDRGLIAHAGTPK